MSGVAGFRSYGGGLTLGVPGRVVCVLPPKPLVVFRHGGTPFRLRVVSEGCRPRRSCGESRRGLPLSGGRWGRLHSMGMSDAPCQWPVDMSCFPDDAVEQHPDLVRSSIDTAVNVLWSLTGRRFGLCEVEYVPDRSLCRPCRPTLFEGEWYNIDPSVAGSCQAVYLPGPVFEIISVEDSMGEPVRFAQTSWGAEMLGSPALVRYVRGEMVPNGAAYAVGRLASQVFYRCTGDKRCELPSKARSVSRQGVQVQFTPPEPGMTGLDDVDMWVSSLNPNRLAQPSEVIL